LEFAPDQGKRVLEELAATDEGVLGFGAQQTLSVWREGGLSFPERPPQQGATERCASALDERSGPLAAGTRYCPLRD
jgi:hypothetical protein